MSLKSSHLRWLSAGLAVAGLAMTPAIARVISGNISEDGQSVTLRSPGSIGSFTVNGVDRDLADKLNSKALRNQGKFTFTPAGGSDVRDRAITVVVRKSSNNAVAMRESVAFAAPGKGIAITSAITPTSYSLGSAKGLKSFAIPVRKIGNNLPDLSEIGSGQRISGNDKSDRKSRFNPQLSIDSKTAVAAPPRALEASEREVTVDVGGSYSLTRNLDVTAGVRYNGRDRLAPLTDAEQDSQAVYVGTKFRF